jgi:hypothetical protein
VASWDSTRGAAPSGGRTTSGGPPRRRARAKTPWGSRPASDREAAAARPAPGWRPQTTSIQPEVTSAARRRPRLLATAMRPSDQPMRAVSPLAAWRWSMSRARAGVIRASSGSHSPAAFTTAIAASPPGMASRSGLGDARRAWAMASRRAFSRSDGVETLVRCMPVRPDSRTRKSTVRSCSS